MTRGASVEAAIRLAVDLTFPPDWTEPLTAEEDPPGWVTIRDASGAPVAGMPTETYRAMCERKR